MEFSHRVSSFPSTNIVLRYGEQHGYCDSEESLAYSVMAKSNKEIADWH